MLDAGKDDSAHYRANQASEVTKLELAEQANGYDDDTVVVQADGTAVRVSKKSVHSVGLDGPWTCAFHQVAALDSPFILGYAYLIISALGWVWGSIIIVLFGFLSLYCNFMLASLHEYGGKRNIRYRDLNAAILGRWAYYPTWVIQYINLLAGNVGLVILSGQFLKAVHDQYNDSLSIKLTEWITISAAVMALFTFTIPHLHHLRVWSAIAVALIFVFTLIAVGIAIKDGHNAVATGPYYLYGSKATKIFDALGALGSIAFAYNIVIIPEVQATIKPPAVRNMYRSICIQYCFAVTLWMAIMYIPYWAYGNGVYPNVLANLSGPKWAITVAQLAAWVQCIISTQIFAAPVYEALDTKFGKAKQPVWSVYNTVSRIVMRGLYWACTAFVAMLLPFFGDFIALIGSVAVFPCCLIFPLLLTAIVHRGDWSSMRITMHWIGVVVCSLMCGAATVASLRFIIIDAKNYSVFANVGESG